MQRCLKVDKITALTQAHAMRHACQLIEVWGEVSYSPNAGLREVVKFHAGA
jgi:hypothetical protein